MIYKVRSWEKEKSVEVNKTGTSLVLLTLYLFFYGSLFMKAAGIN